MIAAIERGNQDDFKDSKPNAKMDKKLIKSKAEQKKKTQDKIKKLKALRLAAEKEAKKA